MFESLDEQIATTEEPESSRTRAVRYVGLFVISALIFAGLYAVIRLVG